MVESKQGHDLFHISRNSLKRLIGHLNIDPKPYAKYENPSSSGSQVIMLTIKIRVRLFFVLMLYKKFQVPSSSGSLVLQPKSVMDRRRGPNQYAIKMFMCEKF